MSRIRARSSRTRGQEERGQDSVPLDLSREPAEILQQILQNVVKQEGISIMHKLGHINNLVKFLCSVGAVEDKLAGFAYEEIIICLRLTLLDGVREVRIAGLRAFRYLINESHILEKVLLLHVDYLIARCIDMQQSNEAERTQALRLARKMLSVNALLFPSSVANSLIAVGNDGKQEEDQMMRACIAIICELSLKNTVLVAQRGGLSTILRNVTNCQLSRINEALITTILHLLNHPHTRQYIRPDVELEQILAPYTDLHYRHPAEGRTKEEREDRFTASKMSLVASFRSWSGIINLCKPGNSGIQSLIGLLCIPNMDVRKGLLEVLYEIFQLTLPDASADLNEAISSTGPRRFQNNWRLSDGFVASEAKIVLPRRSGSRPDLMDNYLALVLSAFIKCGLFEGLVDVITSSTDVISVWATVLVGELLHMANTTLPHSHSHLLHCLPSLVNMAASCEHPSEKRLRASAALSDLKDFHERKKRGIKPSSLYLEHVLHTAVESQSSRDTHSRTHRDSVSVKDNEDCLLSLVRDSHVLSHKENVEWSWYHIETILKWPNNSLHGNELMQKFVQRLIWFYKPSVQLYGCLEVEHPKGRQLTVVGCHLVEFLLASEEEGQMYLEDLVRDVVHYLFYPEGHKDALSSRLLVTLCQNYLLFLGILSSHNHGVKLLERNRVFQCLLRVCTLSDQENLLKLAVSALDYSRDGLARVVLSKILTAASDTCRLYATKHLRVLLRVGVEFFSSWGIELLVTQLHDRSPTVSMEALDILDEACEDKTNLHALIEMRPALLHMGDKGMLLLIRFLSIPKGFSYLSDRGYVLKQMEMWKKVYNLRYVDMIEGWFNEALTTYRKPVNGDSYVRRSSQSSLQRRSVYPPVHLYGQLAHEKTGCTLLKKQNVVSDLSSTVRSPVLENWEGIKHLKAALWALGNIGTSNWGLNLLLEKGVIPDIVALAHHCEVLSLRGLCLYVLGFISKTKQGCDTLKQHGWDAVRHSRTSQWPVVSEELEMGFELYHPTSSPNNYDYTGPNGSSNEGGTGTSFERKTVREKQRNENDEEEETGVLHPENLHGSCSDQSGEDWPLRDRAKLFRSHSRSFNNDTSSSLSSLSPSPSKDTLSSTPPTDATILLNTTGNAQSSVLRLCSSLLSLPKSYSLSHTRPGGRNTSIRRTQSLKYSSHPNQSSSSGGGLVHAGSREAAWKGRWKYSHSGCTSSQDAQGYATLRRLQHQRIQPSLPGCEALGSPAQNILLANAFTINTGRPDSRLTSRRFLRELSLASLDKEELLSPINKATLQRSSSLRSFVSSTTLNSSEDYMGLALPFNITNMLQIKNRLYFKKSVSSPAVEESSGGFFSADSKEPGDGPQSLQDPLKPSVPEVTAGGRRGEKLLWSEEAELYTHNENTCLYCGLSVFGFNYHQDLTEVPVAESCGSTLANQQGATLQAKLSGVSGCSDSVSQGSDGSCRSTELALGVKFIPEDTAAGRALLRKEVLRLVVNLSSSVATKNHETSLLMIKEKFPQVFDDICLYSEVSSLLSESMFRLPTRRFIQELFQDPTFRPIYEAAENVFSTNVQSASAHPSE